MAETGAGAEPGELDLAVGRVADRVAPLGGAARFLTDLGDLVEEPAALL